MVTWPPLGIIRSGVDERLSSVGQLAHPRDKEAILQRRVRENLDCIEFPCDLNDAFVVLDVVDCIGVTNFEAPQEAEAAVKGLVEGLEPPPGNVRFGVLIEQAEWTLGLHVSRDPS